MLVARNIMQIEASDEDPSSSIFKMDGFISNSNYVAKKITMVLFINGTCLYPQCTGIDNYVTNDCNLSWLIIRC